MIEVVKLEEVSGRKLIHDTEGVDSNWKISVLVLVVRFENLTNENWLLYASKLHNESTYDN